MQSGLYNKINDKILEKHLEGPQFPSPITSMEMQGFIVLGLIRKFVNFFKPKK